MAPHATIWAMLENPRGLFFVQPEVQPLMRELGLDAQAMFRDPRIIAWRKLPDRENCTLDAIVDDAPRRLHIKRYVPARGSRTPAEDEFAAFNALKVERIPTLEMVGWGKLADGRSFIISEDLVGYRAADRLIAAGAAFESLLEPTADLAARLHQSGLHHRDLYLCHFFARTDPPDVRLIDLARVARLGGAFTRRRWIVKDLAQFWYSMTTLRQITDEQRERWLARYADQREIELTQALRRGVERKSHAIARHDEKLKRRQPMRNISIPSESPVS